MPIPKMKFAKKQPQGTTKKKLAQEGYTIQSANEVLDDIIQDLKSLQNELNIEASFQSANI